MQHNQGPRNRVGQVGHGLPNIFRFYSLKKILKKIVSNIGPQISALAYPKQNWFRHPCGCLLYAHGSVIRKCSKMDHIFERNANPQYLNTSDIEWKYGIKIICNAKLGLVFVLPMTQCSKIRKKDWKEFQSGTTRLNIPI